MPSDGPTILRPTPRRPFDLNITSATPPSATPSPAESGQGLNPNHLDAKLNSNGGSETPSSFSRTRSILNLTSSTLFGIYSAGGTHEREELSTPWGTGAETPRERGSFDGLQPPFGSRGDRPLHRRKSSQYIVRTPLPNQVLNLALRSILLFGIGMGYGVLVTHLHNDQGLAGFQVEGLIKPSYNWSYLVFWGFAGVGLGSLLPWVDTKWEETTSSPETSFEKEAVGAIEDEGPVEDSSTNWNPVVRSIGAFVGIAFAIVSLPIPPFHLLDYNRAKVSILTNISQRKLPWTSTLQASLTLALVNPVLWYLVDRSKPGFLLSAAVGVFGTTILLGLNPEMMPAPATSLHLASSNSTNAVANEVLGRLVTKETLECGTWIISVLFCSCVCFGNIGRRLALKKEVVAGGTRRRSSFA
jgi:hypothetical protein